MISGLDGAIQRLVVNGNAVDALVEHARDSLGVSAYAGQPCATNSCLNGGVCRPFFRDYVCKCTAEFIGQRCETGKDKQIV